MLNVNDPLIPKIGVVTDIRIDTPDVKTFRVVTPDGKKAFEHRPGQCAMLSIPGVGEAMFSITSSPTNTEYMEFSIKKCGCVTQWLHSMEVGQQITIRGPYGRPFPVDDAFAKTLGFDDLEVLRESLREKKRLSHEANADRIAGAALLDMAGANLTVELPAELLAQNAEYQMTQLRQRLRKSQMTMELYCKSAGLTPEQVQEGYRKEAERQLRAVLAVRAIAEAEKITVTQQEVDAEIARLSKLHDTPEEEIRKVLSRDAIAAAVTNQKVQRFLLDHAALTSVVEKE